MNNTFSFTPDTLTCNGKTFPAGYSVTPSGAVIAFINVPNSEEKKRVRYDTDHL